MSYKLAGVGWRRYIYVNNKFISNNGVRIPKPLLFGHLGIGGMMSPNHHRSWWIKVITYKMMSLSMENGMKLRILDLESFEYEN